MNQPPTDLLKAAKDALAGSYSPYSKFRVAAAIRLVGDADSEPVIFSGANVENASYGLCNCAERTAIFAGVSSLRSAGADKVRLTEVVVYTPTSEPITPCGACRQVLREFVEADQLENVVIWSVYDDGAASCTLGELLPKSFGPDSLGL